MTVYQERRFYFKGKKAIEYWADIDYGVYLQVHESQRRELCTTPPAQLLRPVELPQSFYGVVQDGKSVILPADDGQWLNKTAVIETLRQQGYEVKE